MRTRNVGGIRTVFAGGGTPTLLPIDLLQALLEAVAEVVPVNSLEEYTVEANPATVNDDKARLLVRSGVTRVSMGAQSFDPAELATLERLHTPDDIAPSVATLRRNSVRQVNLDLIFGIPGQSMSSWLRSLNRAIELEPDHISCYGLTYEPATRLTALKQGGRLIPCDEDLEAEMFLATMETLSKAGYQQYEISNYARPGCESRHNLIYWRNHPYIGVGPSAAGCVPVAHGAGSQETTLRRYKNVPDLAGYVRMMDSTGHAEIETEHIDGEKLILELILMQLRLNEGLSLLDFQTRTGLNPEEVFGAAAPLSSQGLLRRDATHWSLTRQGRLQANFVITELASSVQMPTTA